jgi:uncharacterized protein (DUF1800 family)
MNNNTLWSLRLGFSNRQAALIEKKGIKQFIQDSFNADYYSGYPDYLKREPDTLAGLNELEQKIKDSKVDRKEDLALRKENFNNLCMDWIERMRNDMHPLREKMVCFWHNHYVAGARKVRVNYWVHLHNQALREDAFGNFRDLTKKMVKSNAVIRYLDNNNNTKKKPNENLSRELLELFTIGIGNYTEDDVKNGAKGLAGLKLGDKEGAYKESSAFNGDITYLGKTGAFKSDEMVDIIFEQPNIPYLLTRKLLQWFIYDNPPEELVKYYGDYFKKQDFEIKPLLLKMFTEEYAKDTAGSKIKDPLCFIIQLLDELNAQPANNQLVLDFINGQSMELFNQPNVKGWEGGKSWLTTQILKLRFTTADKLCFNKAGKEDQAVVLGVRVTRDKAHNNKQVIKQLQDRLLFSTDEAMQKSFEELLQHDFDPAAPGADFAVLRLFNNMVKLPEFQIV